MKSNAFFLSTLMILAGSVQENPVIQNPFPRLYGLYKIGTHDYFLIDFNREEALTKDPYDKRHLMVQVWYPAEPQGKDRYHPYITNPDEFGSSKERIEYLTQVQTRSVWDAPVSRKNDKYPVLLFSHAAGMTRFSNTFITEALAANGYIVFSIGHTFFNNIKVFPDGYKAIRDIFPGEEHSEDLDNSYESINRDLMEQILSHLKSDTVFVLNTIEEFNSEEGHRFFKRLDLDRIGIFGWSLGGANAAQMCMNDNRLKAGINYDGTLYGSVVQRGIDQPFMLFKSNGRDFFNPSKEFDSMIRTINQNENSFIGNSRGDIYVVSISQSDHDNFSDLVLFSARRENRIDPIFCHAIITAYTLSFFNKYLLAIDEGILDVIPEKYRTVVTVNKK